VLLLCSCAAPYFERAAMEKGWSGGGGVGVGFGSFPSLRYDMDDPYEYAHVAPKVTLFGRCNFSRRFGLFAQLTDGLAYELSPYSGFKTPIGLWSLMEMADFQLGAKFRLGSVDAARVAVGTVYGIVPMLLEVAWLRDLNESWTTNVGLGTRGFSFGIGHHFPLAGWASGHLSLTGAIMPPIPLAGAQATGQLGFAIEPVRR
jgi:hypothetical protein